MSSRTKERATERVALRCTPHEVRTWRLAAALHRTPLSRWIRLALNRSAHAPHSAGCPRCGARDSSGAPTPSEDGSTVYMRWTCLWCGYHWWEPMASEEGE